MELYIVSFAFISRKSQFISFSLITSFNRQEVMFVCYSKDNKNYLRDTNETIFASRWRVFIKKKTNNWAAWNYRTRVLRLSHVFIFIIHLIQQTGSDVCLRFKSYLSDTNETTFASRWRVFINKKQITQQHGITEREYCVYLTFSFSLFTSFNRQEVMFVSDSKDNKSYLRDTNKTIFASRWRVFIKKNQITEQHGITECEYCVYLVFSFSIFTSFNRQEVMFVCDSQNSFCYLRDSNETYFASRRSFLSKNPLNSAAWNYTSWVLRLSHANLNLSHFR